MNPLEAVTPAHQAMTQALCVVSRHLEKAHCSHQIALRLQQEGQVEAASRQNELTRVFLSNALRCMDRTM